MNVLLIAMAVVLIWRSAAGLKKGVVREVIAFVNVLYAALIIGLACMIYYAYGEKNYLAMLIQGAVIIALSIMYSILKLVIFPAKILTKLPVISGMDRFLGLFMGIVETLICFWILCYATMYFEFGTLGEQILLMIEESEVLVALYEYNFLAMLLEMAKNKIMTMLII